MKKTSLTFRVLVAVLFSVYISIFLYSLILPYIFMMPPTERVSFWIKMGVVVSILAPISSFIVYLFYKPVSRCINIIRAGSEIPQWLRKKAMHSFRTIQGFLFLIGLFAYAAGVGLNFLGEMIVEKKAFEPLYWFCRVALALSFGVFNGLVTTRMVHLAWLEAKYLMGITSLQEQEEKYSSTFQKTFLPALFLILFIVVFSGVGAIYYIYHAQLSQEIPSLSHAISHFVFIEMYLLIMGSILFATILWENQSHISNLRNQIIQLSQGAMDLSKRVFILSFDDVGMMTEGINRILEKLQNTFLTIQEMQKIVQKSGEITNNIMNQSKSEAEEVTHIITESGENYEAQVDVIREANKRFKETMEEVRKAISNYLTQQNVLERIIESYQKVISTFKNMIDMTLSSSERFEKLSKVVFEGHSGLSELLDASKAVQETNKKVYEIVKLIMDISDQSNILAMNAAIEASHAGEYGKGFAIVASEVRQLAIHTADSARQIESLIHEMQQKNERGANINEKLNEIFQTMQNEMSSTTQLISNITHMARNEASTAEISLQELQQMQKISQIIKENIRIIESNDGSLSEIMTGLGETAEKLAELSKRLMDGISFITSSYTRIGEAFSKSFEAIQQLDRAIASFRIQDE
ncbi:methyl-accepting chemotaxis protein [Thermospira aquatica]|uniref:Methyl-accepting transducer domain-containing protein n=1 Tax=Thermospira aquatica TaxID=2828656 RepID=A0AAX3BAS6_9SPIR|nr:methyl-accepting chemotaxis protein [Thermospira aquatica]URA09365.1 hypothetical protein KDW03_07670 [Thermospira aquatica]